MSTTKRALDLALTLLLLPLLLPVLAACLVAIGVSDGRPLLHVSERMAAPGRPFRLYKLRTMVLAAQDAGVSGGDKAARITRTGAFLRRVRLDEIPQLWNVLHGDMSLVGPRPPLRTYVERFPRLYADVLQCRPGLTGLATLVYHRHEQRLLERCDTAQQTDAVYARVCVPRKARLDLIYARHQSICFDLAILWGTARKLFTRASAAKAGQP